MPANEKHEVMMRGKSFDVVNSVCNLTAYSIKALEDGIRRNMILTVFYYTMIFIKRLCRLRI